LKTRHQRAVKMEEKNVKHAKRVTISQVSEISTYAKLTSAAALTGKLKQQTVESMV
jgi:hypothetical protein